MKVVITAAAEADAENIGAYIANDNPLRAITFVDELLDVALRLGEYPEACAFIPRYKHRGYRYKPHGSYVIIYAVRADSVVIERIFHGAQDYEAILFSDE